MDRTEKREMGETMAWRRENTAISFRRAQKQVRSRNGEWRTLGIIGAGRGCGVTHLAVWSGNWLQSVCHERTAVLEWNEHGDFRKLLAACQGSEGETAGSVMGVTYYPEADEQEFLACMKSNYRRILIDYGELTEKSAAGWLHCDKRILVGSFSEWQSGEFFRRIQRGAEWNADWLAAVVFGSEEARLSAEKEWRRNIYRIPFSADAFTITRTDMNFMSKLYMSRL